MAVQITFDVENKRDREIVRGYLDTFEGTAELKPPAPAPPPAATAVNPPAPETVVEPASADSADAPTDEEMRAAFRRHACRPGCREEAFTILERFNADGQRSLHGVPVEKYRDLLAAWEAMEESIGE